MKKYSLAFCLLFLFSNSFSQFSNRNKNWCLGYSPCVKFNFDDELKIDTLSQLGLHFGSSNISDTSGKLLFLCNGFYCYTSNGQQIIENTDLVNCAFGTKFRTYDWGGGYYNQMSLILPKKNNSYYVFTSGMSDKAFMEWDGPNATADSFRFDNLNYALVDMDANNGAGKVVEKNNILLQDMYLSHNRMAAVKHGNGKDWWLVKPHKTRHLFYSFLVGEDEIQKPVVSEIPDNPNFTSGVDGQSIFSNNGNLYAYTEWEYKANFYINYFDRCKGIMTKYRNFTIPNDLPKYGDDWCTGVAFSPNDSLLYVTTLYSIYQIDVYNPDTNFYIKISGPDTILNHFPRYSTIALAPNGKVYIGNGNGTNKSMGFIDNPNVKGLGCNFKGRGNGALSQPFTNLLVPPNNPSYGLGALKGSPCDTIRTVPQEWLLYPNPASQNIHIKIPFVTTNAQIKIFNMLGQVVQSHTLPTNFEHEVVADISSLLRAVYVVKVVANNQEFIGKFVVK